MIITFLGTGTSQGIPLIGCNCAVCRSSDPRDNRLRTSILIETSSTTIAIDSGPDFRQQMLRAGVKKLDAVVMTHEHKDHIAGLDDVRAFNYLQQKPMNVFATERVQHALKREFHYVFNGDNYPGIPRIDLHTIGNFPFEFGGIHFTPIEVLHMNLPVLGFRIGDFTYITDASMIPEAEKEKIKGSKVLVLNALRREPHVSHFTLQEALNLMDELKPETGYLIHLSHQLGLHSEIEKELPSNVRLSYDGLQLNFSQPA